MAKRTPDKPDAPAAQPVTIEQRHDAEIDAIARLLGFRRDGLDTILRYAVLRNFVFSHRVHSPIDVLRVLLTEWARTANQLHLLADASRPVAAPLPPDVETVQAQRMRDIEAQIAAPPPAGEPKQDRANLLSELAKLETEAAAREHARRQGIVARQAKIAEDGFSTVRVLHGPTTDPVEIDNA